MEIALLRARTSGLSSNEMGSAAGSCVMPTWSDCECVNVCRPWLKLGVLPGGKGLELGAGAPGSCAGARVGVMGLTGGREGDVDREPRPAGDCGFGCGCGCGREPAPCTPVAPATGMPLVVMVRPGMVVTGVWACCLAILIFGALEVFMCSPWSK